MRLLIANREHEQRQSSFENRPPTKVTKIINVPVMSDNERKRSRRLSFTT
jgi:hypothetical protein